MQASEKQRRRARRDEDRVESVDIFIAEGDPELARQIRQGLAGILNRVTIVTSSEEAMDRLLHRGSYVSERRTPDLILLDAEMIGPECWRFLEDMKSLERFEKSAIVVLSSDPTMQRSEQARRAGATAFGGKPVDVKELAHILEELEDLGLRVVRARELPPS